MTGIAAQPPAAESARPDDVWRRLAPLLAAPGRRTVRLYDASTGKFSDTGRLTGALPTRPAAVHLFTRAGRTHVLALDFDAARVSASQADADLDAAVQWLTGCGAVVVTDRSPGGRHLWVPLGIGTTAGPAEIGHLARLLAARLPTLDITPLTNPASGCLSAPGPPTKTGGGYRQLDGTLADAIEAFTVRSDPALLARLAEFLGAVKPRRTPPPGSAGDCDGGPGRFCLDSGDQRRLAPPYLRSDPLHPDIAAYAERGVIAAAQRHWRSHSEARMAVITAAVARGHSPASIRELIAPGGPWHHGLGAAYARYRHHGDTAMTRDTHTALNWLIDNTLKHRYPQHKLKNSQGGSGGKGARGDLRLRGWLAAALAWADQEYCGMKARWTLHALFQTLAWHAEQTGAQIGGVWVVGVGGRSLSLGAGLLSCDTMWRLLREIRDREGAPVILTRPAVGREADTYALTTPAGITVSAGAVERVRIEPVHDAWSILGHHLRRLYELVAYHGVTRRADLYAAARVSASAGDAAVTSLQVAGLLTRPGRGQVSLGPVSLDDVAAAHHTAETRAALVACYRAERATWSAWLDARQQARDDARTDQLAAADPWRDTDAERTFWLSVMAQRGPPDEDAGELDDEAAALNIIAELLGGRIVAAAAAS